VNVRLWWGSLRERDHLEDMCKWEDNIKIDLKNRWEGVVGLKRLWIGIGRVRL